MGVDTINTRFKKLTRGRAVCLAPARSPSERVRVRQTRRSVSRRNVRECCRSAAMSTLDCCVEAEQQRLLPRNPRTHLSTLTLTDTEKS